MSDERSESSVQEALRREPWYFETQANLDFTKHMGGLKATRELAELCYIDDDKYVLNVGCGVGIASCYVAERYGCRLVGIDISEKMVSRSIERVKRRNLEDKVEFKVADARDLPFDDSTFDAVLSESVTVFFEDKLEGVSEYVRVTKPGGYVGLNEGTWIKTPPPREFVEYWWRVVGIEIEFLSSDDWRQVLEDCGLREITVRPYEVNPLNDGINQIKLIGLQEYSKVLYRFLSMYIKNPSLFKKYFGEALSIPQEILEYWGYGIYVGRKM
jgi:ubiquinone/menaquinone biosynthesis C-methylase UbiE